MTLPCPDNGGCTFLSKDPLAYTCNEWQDGTGDHSLVKLQTNRFNVCITQPVMLAYTAVICASVAGTLIGVMHMEKIIAIHLVGGSLLSAIFCSLAVVNRRLYFLSIGGIVAALLSFFFIALVANFIFTYYIFRSVDDLVVPATGMQDMSREPPVSRQRGTWYRPRKGFDTPAFCVFCGEAFPNQIEGTALNACPCCNHSIPARFRPDSRKMDPDVQYCIHCGAWIGSRASMRCRSCRAPLPVP